MLLDMISMRTCVRHALLFVQLELCLDLSTDHASARTNRGTSPDLPSRPY
jgi:hypothetical protein